LLRINGISTTHTLLYELMIAVSQLYFIVQKSKGEAEKIVFRFILIARNNEFESRDAAMDIMLLVATSCAA